MALYGHTDINIEALKRWVSKLSVDDIADEIVNEYDNDFADIYKKELENTLIMFSECINKMGEGDHWRNYEGCLNPAFYNAFIRVDNSSIRIGDFYECLIETGNIKTYKKIIRGFDYLDTGEINLKNSNGNLIAIIGLKSDLIWTVFYEYFINENYDGSIDYVYPNHERYLSVQLYDVENLTLDEIYARVNDILLQVSTICDMDFKIFEVNALEKREGESKTYNLCYSPKGLEEVLCII